MDGWKPFSIVSPFLWWLLLLLKRSPLDRRRCHCSINSSFITDRMRYSQDVPSVIKRERLRRRKLGHSVGWAFRFFLLVSYVLPSLSGVCLSKHLSSCCVLLTSFSLQLLIIAQRSVLAFEGPVLKQTGRMWSVVFICLPCIIELAATTPTVNACGSDRSSRQRHTIRK